MTSPQLFFIYFAVAMTVLSLLVVTRKNPVHSVLWMLVLFIHIAGLYLFLNAEFLAAIQIIVYAGAILVLFLFVIMLLNLKKEETVKKYQAQWPVGAGIGVILLVFLVSIVGKITVLPALGKYSIDAVQAEGHDSVYYTSGGHYRRSGAGEEENRVKTGFGAWGEGSVKADSRHLKPDSW
jgi:NADH-quinone oxidoreductase subunit J